MHKTIPKYNNKKQNTYVLAERREEWGKFKQFKIGYYLDKVVISVLLEWRDSWRDGWRDSRSAYDGKHEKGCEPIEK